MVAIRSLFVLAWLEDVVVRSRDLMRELADTKKAIKVESSSHDILQGVLTVVCDELWCRRPWG